MLNRQALLVISGWRCTPAFDDEAFFSNPAGSTRIIKDPNWHLEGIDLQPMNAGNFRGLFLISAGADSDAAAILQLDTSLNVWVAQRSESSCFWPVALISRPGAGAEFVGNCLGALGGVTDYLPTHHTDPSSWASESPSE